MKFCTQCGALLPDDALFCSRCGRTSSEKQAVTTPAFQTIPQQEKVKPNVAGLVLGIVGTSLAAISNYFGIVGIVTGIIGLLLSNKAPKSGTKTAGFVLSIIAIVLGGVALLVLLFNLLTYYGLI